MKKQIRSHKVIGYAVVTKAGKVKIDTACVDKESADHYITIHDEETGAKVKRIAFLCQWR